MAKKKNFLCPQLTRSSGPRNRSKVIMTSKTICGPVRRTSSFMAAIVCAMALAQGTARAQQASASIPDITGSWERARDASIPAQPQPPLKAQYLKEYQAKQQATR